MVQWRYDMEREGEAPACSACKHRSRLAPIRLVSVCADGHLADVPWHIWAHSSRHTECRASDELKFVNKHGSGGGLASLAIECERCGSERDLADITTPNALRQIGLSCLGKHPWERKEHAEHCEQSPIVVQRGASNAYFSEIEMALDISLDQEELSDVHLRIMSNTNWTRLERAWQDDRASKAMFYIEDIAEEESCEPADIEGLLTATLRDTEQTEKTLKEEEWEALTLPEHTLPRRNQSFAARTVELSRDICSGAASSESHRLFSKLVSQVVLIDRLRIVRANLGFRRDSSDGRRLAPNLQERASWLPAVEVFGEGIFLTLNEESISLWEQTLPTDVLMRLEKAHSDSYLNNRIPLPTPRFLLVHTLAHLLMRQLCYECGYSASSLAERLYVKNPGMAGLLIYTASGDSEGALGGLVRQGESDRLWPIFQNTLLRGQWCSADPVCRETSGQGVEGLNQAACHACALASETSCENMNLLLDRNMLFGRSNYPGYFEQLTKVIETEML